MEAIHDLLAYEGLKICQDKAKATFSLDSLLLADFVKVNSKTKRIIDIGCGNAPIPLYLSLKTKAQIIGAEIQEEIALLAQKSINLNCLETQITIKKIDCLKLEEDKSYAKNFDIVVSNPPYFSYQENSNVNKNDYLTYARHEISLNIPKLIKIAYYLLKDFGSLYLIHRVNRLEEIVNLLKEKQFKVTRIRFIHSHHQEQSKLFMLEASKYGRRDLVVASPLFVYNEEGEYSPEIKAIFNYKNPNN